MNYGEKISRLRKSRGMTQEELGKILNVTYQAVSKWERDESLPDFATMSQIAKYFQVPLSYFEDGEEPAAEAAPTEAAPAEALAPADERIGVCTVCGKMIKEDEAFSTSPKIICNDCHERQVQAQQAEREATEHRARLAAQREMKEQLGHGFDVKLIISLVLAAAAYASLAVLCFMKQDFADRSLMSVILFIAPLALFGIVHAIADFINDLRDKDDSDYTRNLSLVIGGAFAAVNFALFLTLYLTSEIQFFYLPLIFISVICSFTFVSQYMWGSVVKEIFSCGGFTFKVPGVIFSLTPDSIILMLIVKVFLGFVAVLFFIATTILFALVAVFGSVFTFIPCVLWKTAKDKKAKLS